MMTSGAERCTYPGDRRAMDYGRDMLQREYPASPLVGVGAVIVRDGRVLLVRRGTEPLRGRWSIPGGLIEVGEMLREAVVREAREETGLEVEPVELVELLDRIHRQGERVRYHYVIADYLCRVKGGTLKASSDADEARWVERAEWNSHSALALEPITVRVIEAAWQRAQGHRGKAAMRPSRKAVSFLVVVLALIVAAGIGLYERPVSYFDGFLDLQLHLSGAHSRWTTGKRNPYSLLDAGAGKWATRGAGAWPGRPQRGLAQPGAVHGGRGFPGVHARPARLRPQRQA